MWLSSLLVGFAQALVSGHCKTQLSTLGSLGLQQQRCIWTGAKVGSEFLENMFILLLKVGVIRLGQPREEIPELALDHDMAFSGQPNGMVSLPEDATCQRPGDM